MASKRYQAIKEKFKSKDIYHLSEAVLMVKENANAKFNESVDLVINLGIDPQKPEQAVRGTVTLPYGTGKSIRVLVLTKGEKEKEAKEAGADYVGFDEYIEKIKQGWFDFDALIATPDVMPEVGKLGKILGPRGLMPSPKTNTVTFDVASIVRSLKAGRIQFKTDKTGNIHTLVGKVSFEPEKLEKNILTVLQEVIKLKPSTAKGQYLKKISLSSTMGPSLTLDIKEISELVRKEI